MRCLLDVIGPSCGWLLKTLALSLAEVGQIGRRVGRDGRHSLALADCDADVKLVRKDWTGGKSGLRCYGEDRACFDARNSVFGLNQISGNHPNGARTANGQNELATSWRATDQAQAVIEPPNGV